LKTLWGYARRLQDAGISRSQAEAHADAAREFDMGELVTKTDLQTAIAHVDAKFETFDSKLENLSLRLTARLGVMLAAGIALLGAINKLT
jgi:hypothetical protein